jgi:ABC-2 type transport system permease protein
MRLNPLWQLMRVQYLEFFREPAALFWTLLFPLLMAWGLGIAFTQQGELVRQIAVVGQPPYSSPLLDSLANVAEKGTGKWPRAKWSRRDSVLGDLHLAFLFTNREHAERMIKKGQIALFLSKSDDHIVFAFDPANTEGRLLNLYLSDILPDGQLTVNAAQIEPLTRKGTRYIDFLIPGLIAFGVMNSCLWGISYNLIDKRAKKLLRRMLATPMQKWHFLLAQLATRLSFTIIESGVLLLFARYLFALEVSGDWLAFFSVLLTGNFAFIGIAILLSSRTANTQVGNGLINAVSLPMMILSGVFFSYHNFPDWAVAFIQWLPLTAFADALRAIVNEQAGFAEIWPAMFSLTLLGLFSYGLGLRFYKWY